MKDASKGAPALSIASITVKADRVVSEMRIGVGYPKYSSPELSAKICSRLPTLPKHICKNSEGQSFAAVMNHTSIPHLFEHMVIDLQVRCAEDEQKTFMATTQWLDEKEGIARVEVSFTDDLAALRAFRDAAQILNAAMV